MPAPTEPRWLLLIHQIPPKPSYLRVKIGRRLQGLGAVAVKNSVYVLPAQRAGPRGPPVGAARDRRRRRRGLGVRGALRRGAVGRRRSRRSSTRRATPTTPTLGRGGPRASERPSPAPQAPRRTAPGKAAGALLRLRKRLAEVAAIDFFGAPGGEAVEGLLAAVEARAAADRRTPPARPPATAADVRGPHLGDAGGVHVDRIASAWLIRRFIDPEARFKFVAGHDYAPEPGELRFDMFEAEFTHEGDLCTFEVLLRRFGLASPALRHLAEIVHDIDLKDAQVRAPGGGRGRAPDRGHRDAPQGRRGPPRGGRGRLRVALRVLQEKEVAPCAGDRQPESSSLGFLALGACSRGGTREIVVYS